MKRNHCRGFPLDALQVRHRLFAGLFHIGLFEIGIDVLLLSRHGSQAHILRQDIRPGLQLLHRPLAGHILLRRIAENVKFLHPRQRNRDTKRRQSESDANPPIAHFSYFYFSSHPQIPSSLMEIHSPYISSTMLQESCPHPERLKWGSHCSFHYATGNNQNQKRILFLL